MGADLRGAILSNAKLQNANLIDAKLAGANLAGAILEKADLFRTDLRRANLADTDFSGSKLVDVNFYGATFLRTNLAGATLARGTFTDLDLGGAHGLDTVEHSAASTIGLDVFFRSRGSISDVFLRRAGVPEVFISYVPSFLNQPIQFYSCFISYSHEDKGFARLLHDRLQGQGIRCWLDEHQLLPGDDLHESIDRGIRLWDKILLCASEASLTGWWVDDEINRAFQKEAQIMKERAEQEIMRRITSKTDSTPHPGPLPDRGGEGGRKVLALIPLNLDGFLFSADYQSGKKAEIMSRVAANFVGWEKDNALFKRELEKVIRALRTDHAGREEPPPPRL